MFRLRSRFAPAAALVLTVVLGGATACAPAVPAASPAASPAVSAPAPARTAAPTPTPDPIASLSLEQRVGQLFMVGTDVAEASPATLSAVTDRHAGSIFVHGRTLGGPAALAAVVAQLTALAPPPPPPRSSRPPTPSAPGSTPRGMPDGADPTGGIRLWVATDQEGGEVQVVRGPGAGEMPYAIRQADLPDDQLQAQAAQWGAELAAAGVDVNLAPVPTS